MGKESSFSSSRNYRWLKRISLGLVLVLLVVGISGFFYYRHLNSNIATQPFITPKGKERPVTLPEVEGALNILLMGSDSREGTQIGGETPGLSDTTILLHLAKDKSFAYGVSIPRDTMVTRPSCPDKVTGEPLEEEFAQFNSAFALGGPACTVATVEQMTNVRIDHFIVVDLKGFQRVVDAIGGVTMCVPQEINDPIGRIHLAKGTYLMDGKTALDYVRVRHGIGAETGDIGRMKRQQAFIAAVVEKATSEGTLRNPAKIMKLLEASTGSLTTDPALGDVRKLASLAYSLKGVGTEEIKFITAPFSLWPEDNNRVIMAPEATALWEKLREDEPLTADQLSGEITPKVNPNSFEGKLIAIKKIFKPTQVKNKGLTDEQKTTYGICA